MKQYMVARMDGPDWEKAEWAVLTHQPWLVPNDVEAKAALILCGDRLHVRMEAREREIRAELSGPLCPVCCDSCLEFFLAPVPDDRRYLNLEWNPLGTLYLGFGAERETRVRQIVTDADALFRPHTYRTSDGWGITYSIPEAFIGLYWPGFRFGSRMHGNFYKCGDHTPVPHYLAWAPLSSDRPDFHRRQDFGALLTAP